MTLKLAVIYEDGDVFVELDPQVFGELLTSLVESGLSVKEALSQLERQLKRKTRTA